MLKHNLLILSAITLSACAGPKTVSSRHDLATDISYQSGLSRAIINTDPFALTSYQKITDNTSITANIYIEGDGLAWLSRTSPSLNPTPSDPLALRLASVDPAKNVIYFARPCQYSGRVDNKPCAQKYWMGSRYAPNVIASYNAALNSLKQTHGFQHFNVIGFSGGGTIAALLTASRNDITSLRTVAGNMDHRAHSQHHNVSYLDQSLNPASYSVRLKHTPQHHFIGTADTVVPAKIYESYAQKFDDKSCLNVTHITKATHTKGWIEKWPSLLNQSTACH